jgi:hypothetical protein
MSFVCQKCHKPQPARSSPFRIVVEWYPLARDASGNVLGGQQIKREEDHCAECAGVKIPVKIPPAVAPFNTLPIIGEQNVGQARDQETPEEPQS